MLVCQQSVTAFDPHKSQTYFSMGVPLENLNRTPANHGRRVPKLPSPATKATTRRKRALLLKQDLLFLANKFPQAEYAEMFQGVLNFVSRIAEGTKAADRDSVLIAIEQEAAHTVPEIRDETQLPEWLVRAILKELVRLRIVECRAQYDPAPSQGSTTDLYFLSHTPAGSDLSFG